MIPPKELLAQRARELWDNGEAENLTGELYRMGAVRFIEKFLGAEINEDLGREPYERRGPEMTGYRNGYKKRRLDTAEGPLEVEVPQVCGLDSPYRSRLWQLLKRRTEGLSKLVVEMYARGLSTRDIEDALSELNEGRAPC